MVTACYYLHKLTTWLDVSGPSARARRHLVKLPVGVLIGVPATREKA